MQDIKQWFNYWIKDPFWGGIDFLTVHGLRLLPIKIVSDIGAILGTLAGKYRFSDATLQASSNLQQIAPDKSSSEIELMVANMWKHIGRTLAEMSILDKLGTNTNLEVTFSDEFQGFEPDIPTIFLFPHLGNWELLAYYVMTENYKLNVIYEHLPNRFQRRIAKANRRRIGYELVSPNYHGTRKIFQKLRRNEAIGMAVDEYKKGKIISPTFGRSMPIDSNISYAVKLAKRFNTRVIMGSCIRVNDLSFKIYVHPLDIDKDSNELAIEINNVLENWISKTPEQWYMLNRSSIT